MRLLGIEISETASNPIPETHEGIKHQYLYRCCKNKRRERARCGIRGEPPTNIAKAKFSHLFIAIRFAINEEHRSCYFWPQSGFILSWLYNFSLVCAAVIRCNGIVCVLRNSYYVIYCSFVCT